MSGGSRAASVAVVTAMAFAVPVAFDPHTGEVFNLPKFVVLAVGSLALAALAAVALVTGNRRGWRRSGLEPLAAVAVAWTAVATVAGVDPRLSALGAYGSYGGLVASGALAAVAIVTAQTFRIVDIRRLLGVLGVAGGSVVGLYGLVQVRDRLVGGSPWDPVRWPKLAFTNAFSTLGNPNHLAGFLSIVLPSLVALAAFPTFRAPKPAASADRGPRAIGSGTGNPSTGSSSGLWLRGAAACTAAVALVDLVETGSRGGWTAAAAGLAVLAAALLPELRRHARTVAVSGGALAALVAAVLATAGARILGGKFHRILAVGGDSSIRQHLLLWRAGASIGWHHLATGTGPDTFATVFPRSEPASWVHLVGSRMVANGPHNLFVDAFVGQGLPGLVILATIVVVAAPLLLRTWRTVRDGERAQNGPGRDADSGALLRRVLVGAIGGGIAADVVQGLFDTQQVTTSFCFWLLFGSAGALALDTSHRPFGFRPAKDVPPRRRRIESRRSRAERSRRSVVAAAVTLAAIAAGTTAAYFVDRPYRADHAYWVWETDEAAAAQIPESDSLARDALAAQADTLAHTAMSLNPWEPLYPGTYGAELAAAATRPVTTDSRRYPLLVAADQYLARAVTLSPGDAHWRFVEAQVLVDLAGIDPISPSIDRQKARSLLEAAHRADPRNPTYATFERRNFG